MYCSIKKVELILIFHRSKIFSKFLTLQFVVDRQLNLINFCSKHIFVQLLEVPEKSRQLMIFRPPCICISSEFLFYPLHMLISQNI